MRRLIAGLMTLVVMFLGLATHVSAGSWYATLSPIPSVLTTKTYNLQFTTLSTNQPADSIKLTLKQNGATVGTQTVSGGNSGTFPITVPSDGNYAYVLETVNLTSGGSNLSSKTTANVTVDTTPPPAPIYFGATRNGNTYTLSFKNPASEPVTIQIYSSTATSFTANASTLVGSLSLLPGETKSFSYTAPDAQQRYNAVRSFDSNGIGSTSLTGDPQVVATAAVANNAVGGAAGGANQAGVDGAQAQDQGQVQAATTPEGNENSDSETLGSSDGSATVAVVSKPNTTRNVLIGLVTLGVLGTAGYYLYKSRKQSGIDKKNSIG